MAEIIPFKGIFYNLEKVGQLSEVVTPPYDVISDYERDAFYERHPYNVIRLDKGKGILSLRALDIPGAQVMDFRLLMLKRIK